MPNPLVGACITMASYECRAEHCRCGCRTATEASRQAARDLEAEVQPLGTLMAERYGRRR